MKEMLITVAVVVSPTVFPCTAHASIFSFLGSLVGENASAQETIHAGISYNSQTLPLLDPATNIRPMSTTSNEILAMADEALVPSVGPAGSIADIDSQRSYITPSFYVVQPNDTISLISQMFGVSVDTIKSANNLTSSTVSRGQALVIPPVSGLTYTIKKNDTISSVIAKYKANLEDVLEYNDMSATSTMLAVGDSLFIPNVDINLINSAGNSSRVTKKFINGTSPIIPGDGGPSIPGYFACPVHGARLSQGLHGHNAVDLALGIGNPIDAAASGVVIIAKSGGWDGGYGNYVVISHPNGTETLYAHAKKLFVTSGEHVTQGEEIAQIGMTGNTTGPHVHFEIRGAANPFVTIKC